MKATKLQRELSNIRKTLRNRMVILAKGHRGCPQSRGCGCYTDKAISRLERTEQELFTIELEAYADTKDKPQPHYRDERQQWESETDEGHFQKKATATLANSLGDRG